MSELFKSEAAKATIRRYYDEFRSRLPMPTTERTVKTTFGETHILIAGPESAPPLVMLHGALASSAHVLHELGPLTESHRIYALDVVGQSVMSEDRRIDVRDDSYGRWLMETTNALGLDRFDLYGVSWGGFVALQGTRIAPERVKHLVLLAPAGVVANAPWPAFRDAGWPMALYLKFPSPARLERVMRALFTTLDPHWVSYFGDALQSYKMDMRIPPLAQSGDFALVKCPVLAFGAEEDVSFPGRALLQRVREVLPQAETELIPGSKHCPPLSDEFRQDMATRIERFFDQHAA